MRDRMPPQDPPPPPPPPPSYLFGFNPPPPNPHTLGISPHNPLGLGLNPHTLGGASPHTLGVSPHTLGVSPHTLGVSPHTLGVSPHTLGTNPLGLPSPHGLPNPHLMAANPHLLAANPHLLAANPHLLAAVSAMLMQQVSPPPAPEEQSPAPVWQEHRSEEGRIFWHNTKTNKSTWDKPDELRTDVERVLATSTAWREYPGGEGQYWHNLDTKQSEWQQPAEVAEILKRMDDLAKEDWSERKLSGKSEAKQEFKIFLERRGIGHRAKWEEVGKIIQADPKWKVFDPWMTPGERKHVFTELVNQLQKKVKEEQRVRKAQARDALQEFLNRWRDESMQPDATYDDFEAKAQTEPWFHLLDHADKAEAFEEAAQSLADQLAARREITELVQFFEDADQLPMTLSLDEVLKLVHQAFPDQRAHPAVVLAAWQRFVHTQLEQTRQRSRRLLAREERINRENFRDLLADAEEEGLLNAKTEWRDFLNGPAPKRQRPDLPDVGAPLRAERDDLVAKLKAKVSEWIEEEKEEGVTLERPRVCEDPRYLRMFLQGGSTARELFEDHVYFLWDAYEALRMALKKSVTERSPFGQAILAGEKNVEVLAAAIAEEGGSSDKRKGVILPLVDSFLKRLT